MITGEQMRRKDKEITDAKEIEEILKEALVCRIAMCDGQFPYCIPMNFCYMNGSIYLHSAKEGKELEALRRNNRICFEIDVDVAPITEGDPCFWSMRYRSVVGRGKAVIVRDQVEKREAITCLVRKVYPSYQYNPTDEELDSVTVIRIDIEEMTGKRST